VSSRIHASAEEFDRFDVDHSGELDPKELSRSRLVRFNTENGDAHDGVFGRRGASALSAVSSTTRTTTAAVVSLAFGASPVGAGPGRLGNPGDDSFPFVAARHARRVKRSPGTKRMPWLLRNFAFDTFGRDAPDERAAACPDVLHQLHIAIRLPPTRSATGWRKRGIRC